MNNISKIIIHCSATSASRIITAADIDKWHKARGFRKIGYHYVIRRCGTIEAGRTPYEQGAHARGHNTHSIGICLIGGTTRSGHPKANYSNAQWMSLRTLCQTLTTFFPQARVLGHNNLPNVHKSCPCFDAAQWWIKTTKSHKQ
ncbi:MAG: N-acetylmuramoyl-L-alanine amidase [Desulfovibrio sp.]